MKKIKFFTLVAAATMLFSTSCKTEEPDVTYSVIAPNGTPALSLANYFAGVDSNSYEIVDGADPLKAAFVAGQKDIIVAPVNLGALMYKNNQNYLLYKTVVWGNLYLASKTEITSLSQLSGQTVYVNGQNTTPDIIIRSLVSMNNIENVTFEYTDSVSTNNSKLVSGQAQYVISAEPSLSVLRGKGQNIYTLDLQTAWGQATGTPSYPQAGIFVKKCDDISKYNKTLSKMSKSVTDAVSSPKTTAENAVAINSVFASQGAAALEASIPNCHFAIKDHATQKTAIETYFNKMADLGLNKQFGGTLPVDEFYYNF